MSEVEIKVGELAGKIEAALSEEWPDMKLGWESVLMLDAKEGGVR